MATDQSTLHTGLFKRLLAPFKDSNPAQKTDDGAAVQEAFESVTQLKALVAEMSRLRGLRDSETARESELDAEFSEIEMQRIEALTEFRVSGDPEAKQQADALLKKSGMLTQQKNDCQAVASSVQVRMAALEIDKKNLERVYQLDLARFLDQVFARMCERYTLLVNDLAEAALQMAATQDVMMIYKAGNTNGFERRIYLPTVQPGNGRYMTPILDGDSRHFLNESKKRTADIVAELRNAGFEYQFDK